MKWPLKKKLYVSFGVIVALVAVLGAIVHRYLIQAEELVGKEQRYQGVALLAQSSYTALLQARRHEKDFFARQGDGKYSALHARRVSEFGTNMAAIREALGKEDDELLRVVGAATDAFNQYAAAFERASEAFQQRGNAESGHQGELRAAAQAAERVADDANDPRLTILLLQARRNEKDFLLRNDQASAERTRALVADATAHVRGTQALASRAEQVSMLLEQYVSKFDAMVKSEAQLDAEKKLLHETTGATEQTLDRLVELGNLRASAANQATIEVLTNTDALMVCLFVVVIMFAVAIGRVLSGQVVHGTTTLIGGTKRIASGDLTADVKVDSSDELGELAAAFNQMSSSLRGMSRDISQASGSMNEMVRELQATVSEQGAAMQQQASSVSETVATVEELARSSEQVAEIVRRVIDSAARSVETSREGRDAIQQSVGGMSDVREQVEHIARTILDLSERTQQIGSIIATVDDFAEQSSLLALNASIEAARAGENGKAFAVVAAEVKSLAEQSQKATERVRTILSEIQRVTHTAVMVTEEGSKRVERGVHLVRGAGDIIATLAGSIEASADSAKQIAAAARQQSNGIEQISVAMSGIDQFSRQNVEAIRQTETTSHTLAGVAQQLKTASAQYRI